MQYVLYESSYSICSRKKKYAENAELTVIPKTKEKDKLLFVFTQVLAFAEKEQPNPEEEQLSSQSPMQSQMQTRMQMRMQILKSSRLPKYLVKVQKQGGIITEKT